MRRRALRCAEPKHKVQRGHGHERRRRSGGARKVPAERSVLIVEDDKSFLQRLANALESRGFTVTTAESVADGLLQVEKAAPAFAVVDMRLGDGNGLDVISALKRRRPDARAIILTGYGNIATAVNAVKLGAVDYLAKPVDADDVVAALLAHDDQQDRAAGKSDVGRSRALGAHPAHLRIVRPQCLGDRAPAQHAPPHAAADFGQTGAALADHRRPAQCARPALSVKYYIPIRPVRIDQRLQPQRGGAGEQQHHAICASPPAAGARAPRRSICAPKASATISPVSCGKISHGTSMQVAKNSRSQ